jgi:hypothetical protein
MRRMGFVVTSIVVAAAALSVSACTPEAQEGIGRTIGQLIGWWLWSVIPHGL